MIRILTVLALTLLAVPAFATPASASIDHPLFAEPRPLNRIVADPWRGGMWLGSNIGLILLDPGLPPQQISFRQGLPGTNVYDISVTPDRVWVGTNVGPVVYDKGSGKVQAILGPDGKPIMDESRAVFAESAGAVWVGTNNRGLFKVDPLTLRAIPVENPVNHSAFRNPILGIGNDGEELFISATGYGLVDWHRDTGQAKLYDLHLLFKNSPIYGRLMVTPDRVWVGTNGDGVVYLDRASQSMGENASPKTINAQSVFGLAQVGQETWFATQVGVSRRDGSTNTWNHWQNMPWGNANDVALVRGQVYAAMSGGAIVEYNRPTGQWVNIPFWSPETAPTYNTITGCDSVDGKLLFSTGGGGAFFYDPASHEWKKAETAAGRPQDILVWSTVEAGTDTWFGTQHGAALWDRARDNWTYYRTDGRPQHTNAIDSIRQIAPSDDGTWFAVDSALPPPIYHVGWQPGRLAHLDAATQTFVSYQKAQGLTNDNVTRVALSPGKVWVGMSYGGLDLLDLASNRISHLYPLDGSNDSVEAMLIHDGTLWLGTDFGLWKVDMETYEVTAAPSPPGGASVMSLAWEGDKLWVGTAGSGIYSLDPATGARVDYRAPGAVDIWAYCMIPWEGQLYVGTGGGVERLNLTSGNWLPQMGPNVLTGSPPARIAITTPNEGAEVAIDSTLQARGTAQGPEGAIVQVRLGDGSWVKADGVASWQAQIAVGNETQDTVLNTRLVVGGIAQAQVARAISVVDPDHARSTVRAAFVPVLQAVEGDQVNFTVAVQGANATGDVLLVLPNVTEPLRIPLHPAGAGSLSARSPPLPAGSASYRIELAWVGGGKTLPGPYDGYGTDYQLLVRPAGSLYAFAANPQCPPTLAPGGAGTVSMVLQNTGARSANLSLALAGPGAAWASVPPATLVDAAASWNVSLPLQVPKDAASGTYALDGTVLAGTSALDHFACTLRVSSGKILGIPGLGLLGLIAAVALAASLRKRGS